MSDLTFYTNPMSRGQIVRWMLEETGAAYETVYLSYGGTMQGEDYLKINPMGKVPAIVHNGKVVTETAAICAYLADAFPDAGLVPPLAEKADYYRWLFFAAGPVETAILNHSMGFDLSEEQGATAGYGSYDRTMETLADKLASTPYVCGDAFTAADVYLGAQVGWGLNFNLIPKLDPFVAYKTRVEKRPAWRRAKDIDAAAQEEFGPLVEQPD